MLEITATFRTERHRWDNTAVASFSFPANNGTPARDVSVKLYDCPADSLLPHCEYRLWGRWTTYKSKHKSKPVDQFVAKTFIRCQPHGQAGVIRYLCEAPWVGRSTAAKLWSKFNSQAVKILRESPDVAASAVGGQFSQERATEAAAWLEKEKELEDVTIDLVDLLGGRGFPRNVGKKLVEGDASHKPLGNKAAMIVRRNPYILMRYRGCGFLKTDAMYLDLGHNPAALKRQALAAWHGIATDNDGHTWFDLAFVRRAVTSKVAGTAIRPQRLIDLARRAGLLAVRKDEDGRLWFAEKKKAENEATIARCLTEAATETACWPLDTPEDFEPLSVHQQNRLYHALGKTNSLIGILGGSPGTGKTYSAAALIKTIERTGHGGLAVAAPTGKAAVRITEALAEAGLSIQAKTIHSTLGVVTKDGHGWAFKHGPGNPMPLKYLIVDEASMIDTDLLARLLEARGKGTHILFVGDIHQLPPVGHGAPLRDMIAAGVPHGELREIRRNSGAIVEACTAIRDGKRFATSDRVDLPNGKNLVLLPAANGPAAVERIINAIQNLPPSIDPVWDCQVIVAVNEKSVLGRKPLNKRLQAVLNPDGATMAGSPFRENDKIICLKNGQCPTDIDAPPECNQETVENDLADKDEVYIANGEIGRVVRVEARRDIVRFDGPPRQIVIPRGKQESDGGQAGDGNGSGAVRFDLAYAVTCHKLQGSEAPVVIVALDDYPGARMVCSREWLYTAISRAKVVCLVVGKRSTADAMVGNIALGKRKTFLKELIGEGIDECR